MSKQGKELTLDEALTDADYYNMLFEQVVPQHTQESFHTEAYYCTKNGQIKGIFKL